MSDNGHIIGMKKGTVTLVKHNEKWHAIAQNTIDELRGILKDIAVDIQHIGSTSVHDIYAKPIIDIVIGQNNLNDILSDDILGTLKEYGYLRDARNDNESKIFFYKGENDVITHYIHAVVYGEKAWNSYTRFRDYLNDHHDVALKYQELKLESMKDCDNDMNRYHGGKAEFLKTINKIIVD